MSQKSFEDPGVWTHSPGLPASFPLMPAFTRLPQHHILLMPVFTWIPTASYSTDAGIHHTRHSGACRNPLVVLGLE